MPFRCQFRKKRFQIVKAFQHAFAGAVRAGSATVYTLVNSHPVFMPFRAGPPEFHFPVPSRAGCGWISVFLLVPLCKYFRKTLRKKPSFTVYGGGFSRYSAAVCSCFFPFCGHGISLPLPAAGCIPAASFFFAEVPLLQKATFCRTVVYYSTKQNGLQ